MKKHFIFITLLLLLVGTGSAQSVAQTRCNNFHKGVNLSNWLEGFWVTDWPDTTTYNYQFLAEMKRAVLESIRLPVCFAMVTGTTAPYNVDTNNRVFRIIDSMIQWTTQLNMKLIIDNHHLFDLTDSTWRIQEPRVAHLWSVLAKRYQHLDPDRYYFEILNEPANIKNDSLALFYNPIIDTIRQITTTHSIIVSPTSYSNGLGFFNYQPLSDTNLIYTFHSYDPYEFTHQGLTFVSPPLTTGVPFPNSGYDLFLQVNWQLALAWRDSFHLPLFLGEFGVGDSAAAFSRCNWVDTVAHRIKNAELSSFYWDVVGDFKWYHSGVVTQDSIFPCFSSALGLYGDTLTSVQPMNADVVVKLFPNPAQSVLTVQTGAELTGAQYTVMNELGAVVQTGYLLDRNTNIQLNRLSNGIYFLQIQNQDAPLNRKFLVLR